MAGVGSCDRALIPLSAGSSGLLSAPSPHSQRGLPYSMELMVIGLSTCFWIPPREKAEDVQLLKGQAQNQHSITCIMFGQSRPITGLCKMRRDRAVIYSAFLRSELGAYTGREGSDGDHLWRWQTTTTYAELQRKRLKTFVALSSIPSKGLTCLKLTNRKKVSLENVIGLPRHFSQPASSSLQVWWDGLQASIHFPSLKSGTSLK